MARVTSKLQVTVPKVIAQQYRITPGVEIQWLAAGETIRVIPPTREPVALDLQTRLRLFDQASARQRRREAALRGGRQARSRGWKRADLYDRARAR